MFLKRLQLSSKAKFLDRTQQRIKLFAPIPFLLACAAFSIFITVNSPALLFCMLLGGFATFAIQKIGEYVNLPKNWIFVLQSLAIAAILSFFWLDYFASPAAAQFFGKAEQFFNRQFNPTGNQQGAGNAISLVFNILRALFLLYIAMSLVGVINAVRKDEDWQVVARTPLLVVIAVVVADVLTSFITG